MFEKIDGVKSVQSKICKITLIQNERMKIMKKIISLICVIGIILSLCVVPTSAESGKLQGYFYFNGQENKSQIQLDLDTKTLRFEWISGLKILLPASAEDALKEYNNYTKYLEAVEKIEVIGFESLSAGNCSLKYAKNFKEIYFDETVKNITFYNSEDFVCSPSVEKITIDSQNLTYKSVDGMVFTKDGKTMLYYPPSKTDTVLDLSKEEFETVNLPYEIRNDNLVKVIIPETFKGSALGIYGKSLEEIYVYSKETWISTDLASTATVYSYKDSQAYFSCLANFVKFEELNNALETSGTFPEASTFEQTMFWEFDTNSGTLYLSGNGEFAAFKEDNFPWLIFFSKIKNIVIENGVTSIPIYAFLRCNIKKIIIPKSITEIAFGAFSNSNVEKIYYQGSQEQWNEIEIATHNEAINDAKMHYNFNKEFTDITFSSQTYTYDGTEKALKVAGTLPEGATVTYTNEKGTNAGTYNAKAVIEAEGYKTLTLNATMTITPAPITVKAKDVTIKTGTTIPAFDENSYEITSGELFGNDKITGTLATNCTSTSVAKDFNITQGTLTAGNNYNLTFVNGKLSVVDKTPQVITVDGVVEKKTYGDDGFKITVTPDATSKLDNFTITSSNANVATVDASGNVSIKGAGITTFSVKEAGNDEYAAFEKTWKLTVDKAKVTITADNITKKIGQNDPKLTYTVTGSLYGDDKVSGELTRISGELIGKYDILIGTLAINNNYEITFNKGIFEIVDKTPQVISIADIDAKTYGDESFKLEVTPDETSKLDTFTYASSNSDVADIAADGTVTIKGAGETTITVSQAGNEEYALAEKSVKLVVNPITVTVSAIDMDNKTATIEGVLETDKSGVELDFDSVKTTVISSGKTTVEETTTITSTLKVTNFTFKGEKAKNYVADKTAFLTTTVVSTTVAEKLTEDENVTIEAAPVDDKTIIVTDVAVVPEAEVKKVTIDVTAIADTKVNTVALPKTTVDAIVGIDPEATLEITLKDGSDENKESTITLNAQALAAIQTAGASAATISISVDKAEKEELATEQAAKVDEVSTKTPVVYSLSIVDEAGNSVAGSFGDAGKATVTLPYAKPAGNGNVIVKYLDDLGNLTNISNPKYDANSQTVTVELGHFSEYLIYTEPVVSYGGGGGVSRYTVKFEANGGSTVKSVTVNKNAVVTEPTAPTKDGFKFDGWYTDKELTIAYDFAAKVTKSFTLYAKWTEIEKEPVVDEPDTTISFKDVKATDWFYANVQYAIENKLMNGVAEDKFAPNDTLTRAMLVTVLYRNEGEPAVNKSIPFADVDMGAYYANAVSWAKQNGIVNGVTENEFAPDSNITREQIGAIMFRYAQYKGMDAVTLEENLHFADANEISEYAVSAMNWAVGTGLMKGKSATTINPKDNATRAEIAAILQRFIETNK